MARGWNKLTAKGCAARPSAGATATAAICFCKSPRAAPRRGYFRIERNGAARWMGLGSLRSVPLALARELAAQAREQLARGVDPIASRKAAGLLSRPPAPG